MEWITPSACRLRADSVKGSGTLVSLGRLPLVSILGMGDSFIQKLRLSFIIFTLSGVVSESLHCLLQLDVELSSG